MPGLVQASPTQAALRVRNLRKTYKDVVAVDNLDLEIRSGECFGLLGPNGAGKTTTIEICEGLTEADSGEVDVLGLRWSSDAPTLRQKLGIQLQEAQPDGGIAEAKPGSMAELQAIAASLRAKAKPEEGEPRHRSG